jgi:protein O-mannosyl-transferase
MSSKPVQVRIAPDEKWYLRPEILLRITLALTFLVYLRSVGFDFVFDDHLQIALNPWLNSWRHLPTYFTRQLWAFVDFHIPSKFYRPMLMVWFAAIGHVMGTAPGWYHLATILLHVIVVIEAFIFARLLFRDDLTAIITAAIFGLHPAKVEAVAWVSGGNEPLFAAFFLGTFICYVRARSSDHRVRWTIAALGLFLLALFSKEQAVVGPAILAAYEFWDHRGDALIARARKTLISILPYAIVSGVYWVVRLHVMHGLTDLSSQISLRKTLLTQPLMWLWYLRHLVFPFHLSLFYPDLIVREFSITRVLLPSLALLAIAAVVWYFARKSVEGVMLVALFVLTLAPPAAMVLLVQPHDRHLYLPSFAAAAAVALAIRHFLANKQTQIAVAATLTVVLALGTFYGSSQWESDVTVMERAVGSAPNNNEVRMMLGAAYIDAGQEQRGVATLREAAMRQPDNIEAWQQLGAHEYTSGQYEAAYSDFRRAVDATHFTDKSYSLYSLALISQRLRHPTEAERWARQAIAIDGRIPSYHLALASILEAEGRRADADEERRIAGSLKRG